MQSRSRARLNARVCERLSRCKNGISLYDGRESGLIRLHFITGGGGVKRSKAFYIQNAMFVQVITATVKEGKPGRAHAECAVYFLPRRKKERAREAALYHEEYHDLWNLEQPLPGFIEKPLTPWIYVVPLDTYQCSLDVHRSQTSLT